MERGSPSGDGNGPFSGKQLSFSPFQQGVAWTRVVWLLRGSDVRYVTSVDAAFAYLCPPEGGSLLSDHGTEMPLGEQRCHLIMKLVQKSLWEDEEAAEQTDNPCNCIILISFKNKQTNKQTVRPKREFPFIA